jgi:hypothetical protein
MAHLSRMACGNGRSARPGTIEGVRARLDSTRTDQQRRSAGPSLRIVWPNGHLGFAPIPSSFAIGCA